MTPDFRDETAVEQHTHEDGSPKLEETQELQSNSGMPVEDDNPDAVSTDDESNDERQF